MRSLILTVAAALTACTAPGVATPADTSEGVTDDAPAPETECTDEGVCVFEGSNLFDADGDERAVEVRLPADPEGAPVIFVWHYLGGSPEEILDWMGVSSLVKAGFVVVAPTSRGLRGSEWKLDGDPESNPDVAYFDAILAQLTAQYAADPHRIYATGFSAGGLFTSYLTMNRATKLAATAPFSGGVPSYAYTSPEANLPVMLSWGGPDDTYGGFDFEAATEDFAGDLADDGHDVVMCAHTLGHYLPPDAEEHVLAFFQESADVPAGCTAFAH